MASRAYIAHTLPGRTRLRIPGRRGDRAFFTELADRLKRSKGIDAVHVNPMTGSLLVRYDGNLDDLAKTVLGSDLGDLVQLVLSAEPVAHRLRHEIATLDRRLRRLTHGELDLGTLASLALLVMAGAQVLRRGISTSSVSLAWYAAELLARGTPPPPTAALGED